MGKMETTTSINAQLPISDIIPLALKSTLSVGSLTHNCTKGDNNKFLLVNYFNEHIKFFQTVIVNPNYKFSLCIIYISTCLQIINKANTLLIFHMKTYWIFPIK